MATNNESHFYPRQLHFSKVLYQMLCSLEVNEAENWKALLYSNVDHYQKRLYSFTRSSLTPLWLEVLRVWTVLTVKEVKRQRSHTYCPCLTSVASTLTVAKEKKV